MTIVREIKKPGCAHIIFHDDAILTGEALAQSVKRAGEIAAEGDLVAINRHLPISARGHDHDGEGQQP